MAEEFVLQGRLLRPADVADIRGLMVAHPEWHRTQISRELCRRWQWQDEVGRDKDMACRTLLLKLERRGLLQLPARRGPSVNHRRGRTFEPVLHDTRPIEGTLRDLTPIGLRVADQGIDRGLWETLLRGYHYLGLKTRVGQSIGYLAFDRQGRTVAALLFGAAAWKVADRDAFIGWNVQQRRRHLHLVANNMRFLIPPWVRVPQLASHVLALAGGRVSLDWQRKYGHRLELLETFVEQRRFTGTCYQAANWLRVGETTGRTRNDVHTSIATPIKSVMVYPLRPDFRRHLLEAWTTMTLTEALLRLCQRLDGCFPQRRTLDRATALLVAGLLCCGRKWVTRINSVRNREQVDWTADYRVFSRSPWQAADLFTPAIEATLPYFATGPIRLAGDETRARRGGRKVTRSRWTRDPLSPPFHVNFMKGIRFMQFSALLPLPATHHVDARSIPISFEPVDRPAKPGRMATAAQKAEYKRLCQEQSLGKQAWAQLLEVRRKYDAAGASGRLLLVALDGGFCNRACFRPTHERIVLVARARKDAVLCHPARNPTQPNRVYSKDTFTPESIRQDETRPYQTTLVFFGGHYREVRYKEVTDVLWRTGAGRKRLRLIVVAPTPYQLSPGMRRYYHHPAYLLVTDEGVVPIQDVLQCYFDRWQIEVNHRDEKQHIGVVDAQVWNDRSVDRLPAFMVASYAFLMLASLQAFGPTRTQDYLQPPKWQKGPRRRPSCLDLLAKLREEARDNPACYGPLGFTPDLERILFRAA